MLTYRVRPRVYKCATADAKLVFPNRVKLNFYLKPLQPFGEEAGGGRTGVSAAPGEMTINPNTGQHYFTSKEALKPLDVTITTPDQLVTVKGSKLTIEQTVKSPGEMAEILDDFYYTMPMLLALEFADPPYVERVDGTVGDVEFRWELEVWQGRAFMTTQEKQEAAVGRVWDWREALAQPGRRNLLAAIHYFHTGARLLAAGVGPGEFLAEALLNFSKVLQSLFPPGSMDAARKGLGELGYKGIEIESRFIPAIVLRNQIDISHVDFTIFTRSQLTVLHQYAEAAESNFKDLFKRVLAGLEAGSFKMESRDHDTASKDDVRRIELIAASMKQDAAERASRAPSE